MRDFKQTPEPAGERAAAAEAEFVFVVHKHAARRLHYDLRLEVGGVLVSWAVPKGPSFNPEDTRLAIHVEDHPFEYRHFEGVIPTGSYGAGKVIIWDQGVYEIEGAPTNKAQANKFIKQRIRDGKLHVYFWGQKMRGGFALFRTGTNDKQEQWLFKKLKDEYASDDLVVDDEQVVQQLVERAPVGDMPKNIAPMLGTLHDKPFTGAEWLFEVKWDGYRAIAEVAKGDVKLYSRNLKPFNNNYPEIILALKQIKSDVVLDGEIVVVDKTGVPHFQALQLWTEERQGTLQYVVFDLLWLDGRDLTPLPLIERKRILEQLLSKPTAGIIYADHVIERGVDFFHAAVRQDLEGVMAKRCDSAYQVGIRSKTWLKIKAVRRQEAVIGGWTEPRGGRKHLGALVLGIYQGDEFTYIGHAGTGISAACGADLQRRLQALERDHSPFNPPPVTNEAAHWVEPQLVCEVKFTEWTNDSHMRHPVFIGLRDDKDPKLVVREEVGDEISGQTEDKSMEVENKPIAFTNLNKPFFPEDRVSKGDVIAYYQKIAPTILSYLKDRPEVLLRHPNGINGKQFYQKDVKGIVPDWARTQTIHSNSTGEDINYLIADDTATLMLMANLGCIEINPWSSRVDRLDQPDWVIWDIDPDQNSPAEIFAVALAIHTLLDKLGVINICKTSGKSGLHIYSPLGANYSYETARTFAEVIAKRVQSTLPDISSTERALRKRKGKIYIDYLQNGYGKTVAAPYSLRPWPGATVSTPLRWDELTGDTLPQFTIATIFDRLHVYGDLFSPILKNEVDLQAATLRLEKL